MTDDFDELSTDQYTMGYGEDYLRFKSFRPWDKLASHLAPRLQPGHRVLDVGCGQGNIAVGLAGVVAPGQVYGIDIEPSQVERAGELAAASGCGNAVFCVADALDLPFEDGFFDGAHICDTLAHIGDTNAVLAEVRRVLKAGGILSCREIVTESAFLHPDDGSLAMALTMFADFLEAEGGHPQIGKALMQHLLDAGFRDVDVFLEMDTYSTPEELEIIHDVAVGWFLSFQVTDAARRYGAATERQFSQVGAAIRRWRETPGAMAGICYGRALAVRP